MYKTGAEENLSLLYDHEVDVDILIISEIHFVSGSYNFSNLSDLIISFFYHQKILKTFRKDYKIYTIRFSYLHLNCFPVSHFTLILNAIS